MQPAHMTPQQHTDDLVPILCKGADFYDERTLIDVLMECVDAPISHSLSHVWAQNSQTDLTDISLQIEF